ncbi:MAG: DUF3793 family protein [Christensenellales bacterium]
MKETKHKVHTGHKAAQPRKSKELRVMLSGGCEATILKHVVFEAAPVIKGAKPSSLINLKLPAGKAAAVFREAERFVKSIGLEMAVLYAKRRRVSVLVYNRELLIKQVSDKEAARLLSGFGYNTAAGIEAMLKRLGGRRSGEYPHEIGIFLGYPARDVKEFIKNCGRDCELCGYWKVYHDVEGARRKFMELDSIKNRMGEMLINNVAPHVAAAML